MGSPDCRYRVNLRNWEQSKLPASDSLATFSHRGADRKGTGSRTTYKCRLAGLMTGYRDERQENITKPNQTKMESQRAMSGEVEVCVQRSGGLFTFSYPQETKKEM